MTTSSQVRSGRRAIRAPQTPAPSARVRTVPSGGVQSVYRALDVLEIVEHAGGCLSLSEVAAVMGAPLSTVHRLTSTLVERGYLRRLPDRRYALGSRLLPLGAVAGAMLGTWARPVLDELVTGLGESASLAVLDGDHAVYVGQAPSGHSLRMSTEVGRRVGLHCTGVGKAILSLLPEDEARRLLLRAGMPARTAHTVTDPDELIAALRSIRHQGHAIDDEEQEVGGRCIAVPVAGVLAQMAISVSGPSGRVTPSFAERAIPLLTAASAVLASEVAEHGPA
jgi:IclR family acetate operon transcriptional repressor